MDKDLYVGVIWGNLLEAVVGGKDDGTAKFFVTDVLRWLALMDSFSDILVKNTSLYELSAATVFDGDT